jgi:hypothetical protein
MKTKIIIKMDKDLDDNQLKSLCALVEDNYTMALGKKRIKTNYQILTHKGGVNVKQKLYCIGETY